METRRFDNPKLAEFEAYLNDSYAVKDGDSESFTVLKLSDAKEKIRSLISEGQYEPARKFSERLLKPIEFTPEERSKSFRVQFPVYARLVYESLGQADLALSGAIKKRIVSDLEEALKVLSTRRDINKDKLSLLKREFTAWKGKPTEKRSKYRRTKGGNNEPTTQKSEQASDSALDHYLNYYSPHWLVFPPAPVEAFRQLLIWSAIREYSDVLSHEVLREVFETARTDLETAGEGIADFFDLKIRGADDGEGLMIDFEYFDHLSIRESLEKRFADFSEETISMVYDLGDPYEEGLVVDLGSHYVARVGLKVDSLSVFIEGLPVTEDKGLLEKELLEKLAPSADEARIKDQVLEALDKNDMAKVAEFTGKLELRKKDRDRIQFALKTILHLVKTSQVVSFRAPDIVIGAWEAYGNTALEPSNESRQVGEGES